MLKRAVKNGFMAKYVLVDSWFTSKNFINSVREIKGGAMHLIGGIRNDKRNYLYNNELVNGKKLIQQLASEGKQKRCRKWNVRYFEVVVDYPEVGEVKLYICRFPYQKKMEIVHFY